MQLHAPIAPHAARRSAKAMDALDIASWSAALLLAPFIAFQLYCVGGNIKRGFMPW